MSKQALYWTVSVFSFGLTWFFATHVGPAELNSFMEIWYGFMSIAFAFISLIMGCIAVSDH